MATEVQKSRRFRVALSFSGEHRNRVERVAEAIAGSIGRDAVFYDRWHEAELNGPDLDLALSAIYQSHSELIAVFVSNEYASKQWTGMEGRLWRDLRFRGEGRRLMFFRLDDNDIPGLLAIDGYQNMRTMTDEAVAAAILSRLGEWRPEAYRVFTAKLPAVNPLLIGRGEELAFLDRAWADPQCNFVQVIAAGGTGKTALVDKWFRQHLGESHIFGWSFYSQGSSVDRQTSSDDFFAEIIRWLGINIESTASIWTKASAVADRLRERRLLLILDGVEPLQEADGRLRDLPLKALLQELDTANSGVALCTTRVRIDIPDDPPRVISRDLDNLTPEQGAEYLRTLHVEGADEELERASREYWNHAMSLTLLGTYLVDFCGADVRRRQEIHRLTDDEIAGPVIAAYEKMFAGRTEADVLRALGYFDRPAEPHALKLVLPPMAEAGFRNALLRLYGARLILSSDPKRELDCHPLVREYFSRQTTTKGHGLLFSHYAGKAAYRPTSVDEMVPLLHAVVHGCKAGIAQETLDEIYRDRILQGGRVFYLTRKLGAFGTNLSLLANFFEELWTQPQASLRDESRAWLLNQAGYTLRGVGRMAEALEPVSLAVEAFSKTGDWQNAAEAMRNRAELHLALGNLPEALRLAVRGCEIADASGDAFQRMVIRSLAADILHHSGDFSGARRMFKESERIQSDLEPTSPELYAVDGYEYCDLLLSVGEAAEARHRALTALRIVESKQWVLEIGLNHLTLGRTSGPGSREGQDHLDQAVELIRRSGDLPYLPRALLTRGTDHDLEQVYRVAARSGMRLHLADYHLAMARRTRDWKHIEAAERLIAETGYHRRDQELVASKALLQ